jgi:hypothetical protein
MDPYIFDLDNPVADLNAVPKDLHDFFERTDAGYVVADTRKPVAQRLNGLATNLETERSKRTQAGQDAGRERALAKAYKSVFEGVEGIDEVTPENVKTYFDTLRARAAKGGAAGDDAKAQIEAIKAQMSSAHSAQLGEVQQQLSAKDAQIEKLVKGAQISEALAKHEVIGGDIFKSFLNSRITIQTNDQGVPVAIVVGEDGKTPVYNGQGNPMSVDEFVASLKSKEEYAAFFRSQKKPGEGVRQSARAAHGTSESTLSPAQKIAKGLGSLKR